MKFGDLFQEKINKRSLKDTDEVVFVGMQDVNENATIINVTKLNHLEVKSGFTYFEKDDVLVAKITPCFENGKGGFADGIPTQIGFGSTEFHILRAKNNVDPRYVYFQTKRPRFRNELEGEMVGSAGHRRVPFSSIQKFELEIKHSLEEQTAIANALSDVDALITSLEKLIAKKFAIKTAAMQQLLTGKTRLPPFCTGTCLSGGAMDGNEPISGTCLSGDAMDSKEPIAKARPGYKQTELGKIPEDWVVAGLGVLFESKSSRKRMSAQDIVTFVGMQDVTETARIRSSHKVEYSEVKSGFTYFERNDVLLAKITPCFENGKGGYADAIDTQVGFGSTEFHILRAKKNVDPKYLYYFTNTARFRSELEGEMVGSAGHRRVPFSSVQKYRVAVTNDPNEQAAIANVLTDMDTELDALDQRLTKTQQLKQGMMQELLTGRTRLV